MHGGVTFGRSGLLGRLVIGYIPASPSSIPPAPPLGDRGLIFLSKLEGWAFQDRQIPALVITGNFIPPPGHSRPCWRDPRLCEEGRRVRGSCTSVLPTPFLSGRRCGAVRCGFARCMYVVYTLPRQPRSYHRHSNATPTRTPLLFFVPPRNPGDVRTKNDKRTLNFSGAIPPLMARRIP